VIELYIRIKDGQPFEHPIFGDNFKQVFPHVDVNNLPPEFAKFERVEHPKLGLWDFYEGATYEWFGDVVKDVHHVREMTADEIQIKRAELDQQFYSEVSEVIQEAEQQFSRASDTNKIYWLQYIEELKNMVPVYDQVTTWPNKPIFDSNGNYVQRLTLETARV